MMIPMSSLFPLAILIVGVVVGLCCDYLPWKAAAAYFGAVALAFSFLTMVGPMNGYWYTAALVATDIVLLIHLKVNGLEV